MLKILKYVIPLSIIVLLLPKMNFTTTIIILSVVLHLFFQIGAVLSILNEEILYSTKEKFYRILLVTFIPIVGILIEYLNAKKYNQINHPSHSTEDTITGDAGYFTGISSGIMGSDNSSGFGD